MNELIHVGSRTHLMASKIVMLEAEINYTNLLLEDGKKIIVSYNLGKLQQRFESTLCFIRPNRNILVNMFFVDSIAENCFYVGKKQIYISRRRKDGVFEKLNAFFDGQKNIPTRHFGS